MIHPHSKFQSIESFAHVMTDVRRVANRISGGYAGTGLVVYRPKVKLHGTNAAIRVQDGKIVAAQKRTATLNWPFEDNSGFAAFVHNDLKPSVEESGKTFNWPNFIVHGEWCGPGVQRGVAVSKTKRKFFAAFMIEMIYSDEFEDKTYHIVDPGLINNVILPMMDHECVHVIPWHGPAVTVDLFGPTSSTAIGPADFVDSVNEKVAEVERLDPFAMETFGVEGIGEGLVYYPLMTTFQFVSKSRLMFKAKGAEHQMIAGAKPASLRVTEIPDTTRLTQALVSPARLEQMLKETFGDEPPDVKRMGDFLRALMADIEKECKEEIAASGIEWKTIVKAVNKIGIDFIKTRIQSWLREAA
jgi:hypothetical protein